MPKVQLQECLNGMAHYRTPCGEGGLRKFASCVVFRRWSGPLRLSCRDQIADVRPFSGEDLVVESLLCVDVLDRVLQGRHALHKPPPFLFEQVFPLRNAGDSLEAQFQVSLHLLDAHVAIPETAQPFDPRKVAFVKNPPVSPVPLHVGHKALVAVKFQALIGHSCWFASLCRAGGSCA